MTSADDLQLNGGEIHPKILCVDDEESVLSGLARVLRRRFDVSVATSGDDALRLLETEGPFAAIISDMRMPAMDGAEFLSKAMAIQPEASRIVLTGHADADAAARAVNDGRIYKFLWKPCVPQLLIRVLQDGVSRWAVQRAERLVLEGTLCGSISALTEVLSLAQPTVFGRTERVAAHVERLAVADGMENWETTTAARLFHIGVVALPDETAVRYIRGETLSSSELLMVKRIPVVTDQILQKIPRLEGVREILQQAHKDRPEHWGAKAIRIADAFETLETQHGRAKAVELLARSPKNLDARLLSLFLATVGRGNSCSEKTPVTQAYSLAQLKSDMVLAEDVLSVDGQLLVTRGQTISDTLLERLANCQGTRGVRQPILIAMEGRDPERVPEL